MADESLQKNAVLSFSFGVFPLIAGLTRGSHVCNPICTTLRECESMVCMGRIRCQRCLAQIAVPTVEGKFSYQLFHCEESLSTVLSCSFLAARYLPLLLVGLVVIFGSLLEYVTSSPVTLSLNFVKKFQVAVTVGLLLLEDFISLAVVSRMAALADLCFVGTIVSFVVGLKRLAVGKSIRLTPNKTGRFILSVVSSVHCLGAFATLGCGPIRITSIAAELKEWLDFPTGPAALCGNSIGGHDLNLLHRLGLGQGSFRCLRICAGRFAF